MQVSLRSERENEKTGQIQGCDKEVQYVGIETSRGEAVFSKDNILDIVVDMFGWSGDANHWHEDLQGFWMGGTCERQSNPP